MQLELLNVESRLHLTDREREVIQGLLNAEKWDVIADRLGITPRTVYFHICNVRAKLGVQTTFQVIVFFAKNPVENFS